MAKTLDTCRHCGGMTNHAVVDVRNLDRGIIPICMVCLDKAVIGYYTSPAYEKVGQPTYYPLLKRKD